MTIGQRVRSAREKKKMTQQELAEKLGYKSKSSVAHIENGRDIPRAMVVKLSDILEVSPAYLMGWEDNKKEQTDTENIFEKYDNIMPINRKRFPMLGEIACGEPIFADEDRESFVMADMDISADFCLRAKGDSMIGARINDGDIVFIREMPMVDNGDIAAVIIDNEATLKRFYYDRDSSIVQLVAENPRYAPLIYTGEQLDHIRVLGKAVYFMSSL